MMSNLPLPIKRDLFLAKEVNQASMEHLSKDIIEINRSDEELKKLYGIYGFEYHPRPINIFIDTYGGEVYPCLGLLSIIDKSKTPVYTFVTGSAMSCGFLILIHGHKRFAYENATPMYHQVGSGVFGFIKDMQENIEEVHRLQIKLEEMTLEKTKITKKKIDKIYKRKKNWFMTASEALKYGVVDEII